MSAWGGYDGKEERGKEKGVELVTTGEKGSTFAPSVSHFTLTLVLFCKLFEN